MHASPLAFIRLKLLKHNMLTGAHLVQGMEWDGMEATFGCEILKMQRMERNERRFSITSSQFHYTTFYHRIQTL